MQSALGLDAGDIDWDFNPVANFTDAFIAVRRDVLVTLQPEAERIRRYLESQTVPGTPGRPLEGVHVFALDHLGKNQFSCRNFAPAAGINEEAATGSACGLLAQELKEQQLIVPTTDDELLFRQGEQMEHGGGEVFVKFNGSSVLVGGRVEAGETTSVYVD